MKKNICRKIAGIACAVLASAILTIGCSSAVDANATVMTVNGEAVPYGVARFYTKIQQITYETYYGSIFGEDMWNQKLDGVNTFGDSTREGILEELKELYILNQHAADYNVSLTEEETAAVNEAADKFMADNSEKAVKAMGADKETVARYLTLYTVQNKVRDAILEGVDREVSDEDAAQKTISYIELSAEGTADEEGNVTPLTDEEKAVKKEEAQALADRITDKNSLQTAATEGSHTVSSASYGKDDDGGLPEAVIKAADALSDGAVAGPVETEDGYYIIHMDSTKDEAATESRRAEIISEREEAFYNELYTGWSESSEFKVEEKVWKKIQLDGKLAMATGSSEEPSETGEEE